MVCYNSGQINIAMLTVNFNPNMIFYPVLEKKSSIESNLAFKKRADPKTWFYYISIGLIVVKIQFNNVPHLSSENIVRNYNP